MKNHIILKTKKKIKDKIKNRVELENELFKNFAR